MVNSLVCVFSYFKRIEYNANGLVQTHATRIQEQI